MPVASSGFKLALLGVCRAAWIEYIEFRLSTMKGKIGIIQYMEIKLALVLIIVRHVVKLSSVT